MRRLQRPTFFRFAGRRYWLTPRTAQGANVDGAKRLTPRAAQQLVLSALTSGPHRQAVRAALTHAGVLRANTPPHEVKRALEHAFGPQGRLRLLERRHVGYGGQQQAWSMPEEAPFAPEAAPEELDWFEVFVEDDDGQPVAGVPYWYEANGRVHTGRTDRLGYLYVSGVEPGSYDVHFTMEDGRPPQNDVTPPEAQELTSHPVETQIVDEAGNPMADVACEVTFPDDSKQVFRSDADGWVRAQSPSAGECQVRLLGVDPNLWDPCETSSEA